MGVQGLRKLIESSGCARQLSEVNNSGTAAAASDDSQQKYVAQIQADHVLIDMNGVIHGAFTRLEPDAKATIRNVVAALRKLLEQIVSARRSLILCFDGPAPFAKLNTQRQRRRKVSHLDVANNCNFSDLSITTGSVFMLELEQHITRFLSQNSDPATNGFLSKCANISLCGTSVPGEGEAKIANSLARIAATVAHNENDSVVVVGNDIDLVLTCIGATSFHNIGVLNPQTFQIIDVGSFLARWVAPEDPMAIASAAIGDDQNHNNKNNNKKKHQPLLKREEQAELDRLALEEANVQNELAGLHQNAGGFISFANLPGARIDFVWLFMLNGSDYYDGLGDAALSLWKRYRMLKKQRPDFRIVSKTHSLIINSLRALFQCEQIEVTSDKIGLKKSGKRRQRDGGKDFDDYDEEADDDLNTKGGGAGKNSNNNNGEDDEDERRRGALKLSPEQRHAAIGLLNASIWSLITTVTGVCPNFRFRPVDPKQYSETTYVSYATMRAAVATHEQETIAFLLPKYMQIQIRNFEQEKRRRQGERINQDSANYSREEMRAWIAKKNRIQHLQRNYVTAQKFPVIPQHHPLAPLSPLQTYVALMPRKELLPKPIAKILERDAELMDGWTKQSYGGQIDSLPQVVQRIFQQLDVKELTPAERFLTQFGEPVDVKGGFFHGHPHGGVARRDQEGNRKYGIDFFRFAYGSKAHSNVLFPKIAADLVPGAKKMNTVTEKIHKLLTKKEKIAQKKAMKLVERELTLKERQQAKTKKQKKAKMATPHEIRQQSAQIVAAAAGKKKLAAQKQIKSQLAAGTTLNRTTKQGEIGGTRTLYWFDVFNKASKTSAGMK